MPTFERSIDIRADRAALFALMQDYDRRLEWDEFLSAARLVGGATESALGARAFCVDRSGRGMETEYVAFRPPERVAVKMTQGPGLIGRFAGAWIYREPEPGTTRLTFRYHVQMRPRWLARLLDPIATRFFANEMEARLRSLKAIIEAHPELLTPPAR